MFNSRFVDFYSSIVYFQMLFELPVKGFSPLDFPQFIWTSEPLISKVTLV